MNYRQPKTILIILLSLSIVFLAGIALFNWFSVPKIQTTDPTDAQKSVDLASPITITFVSTPNQKRISLKTTPEKNFSYRWQNNILVATPTTPFPKKTEVKTEILIGKRSIYQFAFTTSLLSAQEKLQQLQEQARGDHLFDQERARVMKKQPYLEKLPVITADYEVVYDYLKNKLLIHILNPQVTEKQLLEILLEKGIDAKAIGYYVILP